MKYLSCLSICTSHIWRITQVCYLKTGSLLRVKKIQEGTGCCLLFFCFSVSDINLTGEQRRSQRHAQGTGPDEADGGRAVAQEPRPEKKLTWFGKPTGRLMCYSQAEKREIIHLVEHSNLSIRKTLKELDVPRSSFYRWYLKYQKEGYEGLVDMKPRTSRIWNRIPEEVKEQVVDLALNHPEKSCRQITWQFVDQEGYFLSESSVYRILKSFDLVQSPLFEMIGAKEKFEKPTQFPNELWQTDFTQFRVVNRGWFYLFVVLLLILKCKKPQAT